MSLDPTELTYDTPALSSREQESPGDVLTKVYKAKYLSVSFTAGSSRTEDSSPSLDSSPENSPVLTQVMSSHVPRAGSDSQVVRAGRQVLNLLLQSRLPEASDSSKAE